MPNVPGTENLLINKLPITTDPGKNVLMGAGIGIVPNAGFGFAMQGMDPMAAAANTGMAAALNVFAQPIKNIPIFPERDLLKPLMFIIALAAAYFIIFHQDLAKAFITASTSTITAVTNYKADKAAGTNILEPTPIEHEFRRKSSEPTTTGVVS